MTEPNLQSIKATGLLISIFSILMIFANTMGAVAWSFTDMGNDFSNTNQGVANPLSLLFSHYDTFCLSLVAVGIVYLICGLGLRKHRLWAQWLATLFSMALLMLIWLFVIVTGMQMFENDNFLWILLVTVFVAILCSVPFTLLIRFLKKKEIKSYFS